MGVLVLFSVFKGVLGGQLAWRRRGVRSGYRRPRERPPQFLGRFGIVVDVLRVLGPNKLDFSGTSRLGARLPRIILRGFDTRQ